MLPMLWMQAKSELGLSLEPDGSAQNHWQSIGILQLLFMDLSVCPGGKTQSHLIPKSLDLLSSPGHFPSTGLLKCEEQSPGIWTHTPMNSPLPGLPTLCDFRGVS